MTGPVPARTTYRHGDLRQALLDAGLDMARRGGPDAVVLREATRQAGVSPNAAYRHFADRDALVRAVSDTAQGYAADHMAAELARIASIGDPAADARLRLRAVGTGYLRFAREEPGLFRAAFSVPHDLSEATSLAKQGASGLTPFGTLGVVLDELTAAGVLPPERRLGAELLAWSSVHGLGMLVIDGPLRGLDERMIDLSIERLLDLVDRGI
jgi:AcrR family transcriptional regulator